MQLMLGRCYIHVDALHVDPEPHFFEKGTTDMMAKQQDGMLPWNVDQSIMSSRRFSRFGGFSAAYIFKFLSIMTGCLSYTAQRHWWNKEEHKTSRKKQFSYRSLMSIKNVSLKMKTLSQFCGWRKPRYLCLGAFYIEYRKQHNQVYLRAALVLGNFMEGRLR